ncbi:hypothetical protein [Acinetobacter lwoffii]|jgi:hypothetical protein|uniref:hypothetical protein n=1 Tax=Acinetobacter lwoffii TaxID=28090 RepID=UPI003F8FFD6B
MYEEVLKLYGFGSFFNNGKSISDIDFVIIHRNTSRESCEEAISLKQLIVVKVPNADVTMLSEKEESEMNFIEISRAKLLGSIKSSKIRKELFYILDQYEINII